MDGLHLQVAIKIGTIMNDRLRSQGLKFKDTFSAMQKKKLFS